MPDSLPELTSEFDSGPDNSLRYQYHTQQNSNIFRRKSNPAVEPEATSTPPKKKRPQPSREDESEKSPRKLPFGQTPEKKKDSPRKKKQQKTTVTELNTDQWIPSRHKKTTEEEAETEPPKT